MDFGPTYRKVYLKSGEFKMRVSVTSNELVNKDIELNATITMKINAKAL